MPSLSGEENIMSQAEVQNRVIAQENLKPPSMFRVIYMNDNTTSMEFVIDSLIEHFDYTAEGAEKITYSIHDAGSAVVAVLPFEIAEQKGIEVTLNARANQYPLQIKLEPEDIV
jgi:ATP-dependent Clp protease adaptor protein ClpS